MFVFEMMRLKICHCLLYLGISSYILQVHELCTKWIILIHSKQNELIWFINPKWIDLIHVKIMTLPWSLHNPGRVLKYLTCIITKLIHSYILPAPCWMIPMPLGWLDCFLWLLDCWLLSYDSWIVGLFPMTPGWLDCFLWFLDCWMVVSYDS